MAVMMILSLVALLAGACARPTPTSPEPVKPVSQKDSQQIAEEFVRNSPTFIYDGSEDTLILTETATQQCPYCWQFNLEFDSRHSGYGDRTGQVLAQVITHHKASITVEQGEVTYAVIDYKWDMISQQVVGKQEKPGGTMSVSEFWDSMIYNSEVKIYGEVSLLGELLCPCFLLTSGGENITVWYDLMIEDDGTARPPVSVAEIKNGDYVIVTGELKTLGEYTAPNDFWAVSIEKIE